VGSRAGLIEHDEFAAWTLRSDTALVRSLVDLVEFDPVFGELADRGVEIRDLDEDRCGRRFLAASTYGEACPADIKLGPSLTVDKRWRSEDVGSESDRFFDPVRGHND
jgi:hypothetical protein